MFIFAEGELYLGVTELIGGLNERLLAIVWGTPMLVLIVGSGIYFTLRCRGVQFVHFGYAMKNTIGRIFEKNSAGEGEISPFQAVTTALAATVGTGNIAGVTGAIVLGGPGSIFWLWMVSLIGMCVKYAEVVLAVKYRERNEKGDRVGGPMYYITGGLGKNWRLLALTFSAFGALAAFGIGNAVQVRQISASMSMLISAYKPNFTGSGAMEWTVGIVVAAIVAATLLGGIKRLGQVTEKLVPIMSIVYIVATLSVIVVNFEKLGGVLSMIFETAFNPAAVGGGVAGFTLMQCVSLGVKRGVFSNEAGLGSAPIAHAASSETNPVKQGMFGIFEVFADTIVICTLTALALLMSGVAIPYGNEELGNVSLNSAAFASVFGEKTAGIILAVGISSFALATVLSWGLYGSRCCEYIFGSRSIKPYQVIFALVAIVGAVMRESLAWEISDSLNGLMAIPNLIALLGLSGVVARLTREHFRRGAN